MVYQLLTLPSPWLALALQTLRVRWISARFVSCPGIGTQLNPLRRLWEVFFQGFSTVQRGRGCLGGTEHLCFVRSDRAASLLPSSDLPPGRNALWAPLGPPNERHGLGQEHRVRCGPRRAVAATGNPAVEEHVHPSRNHHPRRLGRDSELHVARSRPTAGASEATPSAFGTAPSTKRSADSVGYGRDLCTS
jgi:hypothetical protein